MNRELDRQVAERVMGWTPTRSPMQGKNEPGLLGWNYRTHGTPEFSTDPVAMCQVIETMRKKGYLLLCGHVLGASDAGYFASFYNNPIRYLDGKKSEAAGYATGKTLPGAVCCATLAACAGTEEGRG